MKELIETKISELIKSSEFKTKLEFINENYSNLKQELFIRNAFLETLNIHFNSEGRVDLKAFAEHPRGTRGKGTRVDLSIVRKMDEEKKPFQIELKYQFSKDYKYFENYEGVIRKDFEDRKSDMFILIISNWDKENKKKIDDEWGIAPNLHKYITSKEDWKKNIEDVFETFIQAESIQAEFEIFDKIEVDKPYLTEYHFYILKRKI